MRNQVINFTKENKSHFAFVLFTSILFSAFFSYPDFYNNPINNWKDFLIIFSQWGVIWVSTFGLIYLISIYRITFLLLFPLLTFACSILAYFRFTANVVFTSMIVDAALNNDFKTSQDLISLSLICFSLISLLVSLALAFYRVRKIQCNNQFIHIIIAGCIILGTNVWIDSFKRPVSNRIPYILFYSVEQYYKEKEIVLNARAPINSGALCNVDSLTIVVVLGESLRPDHMSLNGYKRSTTPQLAKQQVISLPNIYTEYTYTNRSLPHILTRADSLNPNLAFSEPSFISIFNYCKFKTTWLANQESAETYIYFMKECQNLIYANIGKNSYNFDSWIDGELLPHFDTSLKSKNPRNLIVLHTIGSHWWYNSHYPKSFQKFNPIVKSRVLSSCSAEEMINSYDNTILYTDHFLSQVIDRIKDRNAILIFLSDHGESLGENGQWLHASEAKELHSTAAFVWMSNKYKSGNPEKYANLLKKRTGKFRTDFLFHSVLDAANIKSPILHKNLSIF